VQDYLLKYDGAWRIQEVKDLAPRAHERWEAEKPLRCPGIASGRFDAAKEFSYAVLLVPVGRGGAGHRLIAFSPVRGSHSYIPKVLGESKDTKSSALFVHTIRIGSFFDPQSKEKFRVQAPSGILFIEADDKAYEADVYFWGSGSYQKQPIDY
jgi:hypothetical protein